MNAIDKQLNLVTGRIIKRFDELHVPHVPVLIAGPTCSGKTTFAKSLKERLGIQGIESEIICQDDYFRDRKEFVRTPYGLIMDSPSAFHIGEFINDVIYFLITGTVNVPDYNVSMNERVSKNRKIMRKKVTIIEGLHVISIFKKDITKRSEDILQRYGEKAFDEIRQMFDTALFLYSCDSIETCKERRINRDVRNFSVPALVVKEYFEKCIIPQYKASILPQKSEASLLIYTKIGE